MKTVLLIVFYKKCFKDGWCILKYCAEQKWDSWTHYRALPLMGESVNEQENCSWGILRLVNKQFQID